MGTTRIKVIDLSSDRKEIKTSRKHAEKLGSAAAIKKEKKGKGKPAIIEVTKVKSETTKVPLPQSVQTVVAKKPQATEITYEKSVSTVVAKKSAPAKTTVAKKHHHLGKKYNRANALVDKNKLYSAKEAIELLSKTSFTRFDPTVEIHLNVVDKNVHGKVNFPHAVRAQKPKKYLIFGDSKTKIEASDKHIIWGDEKTIEEITKGSLKPKRDFDQVFSTPKFMSLLAKVAKILGPAGLMPNPKNGTIVEDISAILQKTPDTGFEYKTDPTAPIIHTSLGKLSVKPQAIEENLKALVLSIGPTKIRKAVITSSMGPGIKLDVTSVGH